MSNNEKDELSCSKPDEEDREIEYNNKSTQEKSEKSHRDLPTSCANNIIPQGPRFSTHPKMITDFKLTNLNSNCVQSENEFDKMFKTIIGMLGFVLWASWTVLIPLLSGRPRSSTTTS